LKKLGNQDITVPEYVYDVHTLKGKRMGKTKEDFFKEEQQALENAQISIFDIAGITDL